MMCQCHASCPIGKSRLKVAAAAAAEDTLEALILQNAVQHCIDVLNVFCAVCFGWSELWHITCLQRGPPPNQISLMIISLRALSYQRPRKHSNVGTFCRSTYVPRIDSTIMCCGTWSFPWRLSVRPLARPSAPSHAAAQERLAIIMQIRWSWMKSSSIFPRNTTLWTLLIKHIFTYFKVPDLQNDNRSKIAQHRRLQNSFKFLSWIRSLLNSKNRALKIH